MSDTSSQSPPHGDNEPDDAEVGSSTSSSEESSEGASEESNESAHEEEQGEPAGVSQNNSKKKLNSKPRFQQPKGKDKVTGTQIKPFPEGL